MEDNADESAADDDDLEAIDEADLLASIARLEAEASGYSNLIGSVRPAVDTAIPRTSVRRRLHKLTTEALASYSYLHGPPHIKCHPTFWQSLLQTRLSADVLPHDDSLQIWVSEWPSHCRGACSLTARQGGIELGRVEMAAPPLPWQPPLHLSIPAASLQSSNADVIVVLHFGEQHTRHLHIVPPRCLHHLLEPPFAALGRCLLAPANNGNAIPPPLPTCTYSRGFGIELELLTVDAPTDSWPSALAAARNEAHCGSMAFIDRLSKWEAGYDISVRPVGAGVAKALLAAHAVEHKAEFGTPPSQEELDRILRANPLTQKCLEEQDEIGGHSAEMRSPKPPHELSFANGAAEELVHFVRMLRRMGPAALPPWQADGQPCTSTHVHVNVRCELAAGTLLSPRQILAVWLSWVKYDLITARLAKPWRWRTCSSLFATGPEPEEGMPSSLPLPSSLLDGDAWQREEAEALRDSFDVPAFVAHARETLGAVGFDELTEHEQLERLFESEGAKVLGRTASLNLQSLSEHGTLEFRRFHSSACGATLAHWAAFCVGFVECFHTEDGLVAAVLEAPTLGEGLAALREAQEAATMDGLRQRTAEFVSEGTFGLSGC